MIKMFHNDVLDAEFFISDNPHELCSVILDHVREPADSEQEHNLGRLLFYNLNLRGTSFCSIKKFGGVSLVFVQDCEDPGETEAGILEHGGVRIGVH